MIGLCAVERLVLRDDGVPLIVTVEGKRDVAVRVVFCHGYGMSRVSWCFQRAALAATARVVSYDQRGHGCSGDGEPDTSTIDQVGRDLCAVLEQSEPHGPVLLVGHSLGAMSIMALAAIYPGLVGERVLGVALLATSAGPAGIPSLGALDAVARRAHGQAVSLLHPVVGLLRRLPANMHLSRDLVQDDRHGAQRAAEGHGGCADPVRLTRHAGRARRVAPGVGEQDLITPVRYSRQFVEHLPGADSWWFPAPDTS